MTTTAHWARWFIPESIESTIKNAFNDNQKSQTVTDNQSQTVSALVCTFQQQLEAKDRQIERLQELLDQEQKLRMVVEQRIQLLEEKKADPIDSDPPKKWWHFFK